MVLCKLVNDEKNKFKGFVCGRTEREVEKKAYIKNVRAFGIAFNPKMPNRFKR